MLREVIAKINVLIQQNSNVAENVPANLNEEQQEENAAAEVKLLLEKIIECASSDGRVVSPIHNILNRIENIGFEEFLVANAMEISEFAQGDDEPDVAPAPIDGAVVGRQNNQQENGGGA